MDSGDERLVVAEAAARDAGGILLAQLGRIPREGLPTKTSARDLVTAADLAAERAIVARLRASFPDHAIEAEEETSDARSDGRPRWFLDPLDGTVNFVHRLPAFAVSIALWERGEPQVAVVHAPKLGETFTAVRGGGAFLDGAAIGVSRTETLGEAMLATGFPYRRGERTDDNLGNFGRFYREVRDLRRFGSAALDLAWVAAGRFDGFWELALSPHDVAAGGLLVREAGGRVTDFAGGEDWLRGGNIVASNGRLHEAVRGKLAQRGRT